MENAITPLQRAFNAFLFSMPPQQLEELLKYIQDTRAQMQRQALLKNENHTARISAASDKHHGAAVLSSSNPRSAIPRGRRNQDAKRRPLNSFIAFRSFYSVIFPDLTQKAKSGILRFLWQNDPFKAKWTIIAKAYSIIRDDHDAEVSLESFLALNTDLIGIPNPDRYLDAMGWQLNVDGHQQYTMARIKNPAPTEAELSTNYSVNDIVKNCYDTGYVSEESRKNKEGEGASAPVMSFAAQPTLIVRGNNGIQISGNHTIVSNDSIEALKVDTSSPEPAESTDSPSLSEMSPVFDESAFEPSDVSDMYNSAQLQGLQTATYFDIGNMQFLNWNDQVPLLPYNTAPLVQETLESFDFNNFLDL